MRILNFGSLNIDYVYAVDRFVSAGDTFTGYFFTGISKGMSPEESLKWATKASDITVTRKGAAESIPYASEIN